MQHFLRVLFLSLLCSSAMQAQTGYGITPAMLSSMRDALPSSPAFYALENAVAGTDVATLAVDHDVRIAGDAHFTHRIKTSGITNQKRSGRCWIFAGLNILRPGSTVFPGGDGITFSQNYLFFFDKLEKANSFLESVIELREQPLNNRDVEWVLRHPLPDGGQWNMVTALIAKYGIVPSDIMPETHSSSNTATMNSVISAKLLHDARRLRAMHADGSTAEALRSAKTGMLADVYRMLVMHLGRPPESFTWRSPDSDGKVADPVSYTPKEFYDTFVQVDLEEYVCLHNVPSHDLNRLYEIRFDRNMADAPNMTFINLSMSRLTEFTLKSVLANEPVWYGCDVGKESDRKSGMMKSGLYDYQSLYGVDLTMSKADRIRYGLGTPSHAMAITGVDIVNGSPQKWLVENSWGAEVGTGGMFVMDQQWFEEYTYSVIIHRKYLPKDVLDILSQDAEQLPPWDPMYAM